MSDLTLQMQGLTRRDFMKIAGATVALLGLDKALTPRIARAVEASAGKPALIWLHGLGCTGCVESFLNSSEPSAMSILLDTISLRYAETAMAGSGQMATDALEKTLAEGGYILVIDGAIPLAQDGRFCMVGGRPFKDIVREAAGNAGLIVCSGACASFGGIPRSGPTDAVGYLYRGTERHHFYDSVGRKPVINLPTCPLHNERMVATLIYYLTFGVVPELDAFQRPLAFYGYNQHENCERRGHFDAGEFVTDWSNPAQYGRCLFLKGCKGPIAMQDCWKRLWNNRTNYCIHANFPCVACSMPEFYEKTTAIVSETPTIEMPVFGRVSLDTTVATMAGLSAVVGAGLIAGRLIDNSRHKTPEKPVKAGRKNS